MTQSNAKLVIFASAIKVTTFETSCGYIPIYVNEKPAVVCVTENRILLNVDDGTCVTCEQGQTNGVAWTMRWIKHGPYWDNTDSPLEELLQEEGFTLVEDLPDCLWQQYDLYPGK